MKQDRRYVMLMLSGICSGLLALSAGGTAFAKEKIKQLTTRIDRDRLPSSRPTRAPHMYGKERGDEFVLYRNGDKTPLCRLNQTAKTIWENCNGRRSLAGIAREISRIYRVSPHQAYVDCLVLLARLHVKGAITL